MSKYTVYSDGSSSPHTENHPGAWAFLILDPTDAMVAFGYGARWNVTNNIMELQGAIAGLQVLQSDVKLLHHVRNTGIQVVTDSQYVIQTATGGYQTIKNPDLVSMIRRSVNVLKAKFEWVKGHQVSKKTPLTAYPKHVLGNHRCDQLAHSAKETLKTTKAEFKNIQVLPRIHELNVKEVVACQIQTRRPQSKRFQVNLEYWKTSNLKPT